MNDGTVFARFGQHDGGDGGIHGRVLAWCRDWCADIIAGHADHQRVKVLIMALRKSDARVDVLV